MHGFLVNETLHVPLEFGEDCSQCWVWILSFCIMYWELLWCARELFLSGTLPQCSVDIYTLGLVLSHCQVSVCFEAALWADGRDKFNILGFSVTLATKARISVLSLYQASPVLAFFVVLKTGCVPCTWQNIVADSHGTQAGRVSEPESDPGVGSLACGSVLCRWPSARSADTLGGSAWPAHRRGHSSSPWGSAGRATLPGFATVWSQLIGLLLLSAAWLSACWLQSGALFNCRVIPGQTCC